MKDLEQRVSSMVKKYMPDSTDADKVQMAAFLTCECWNLINEAVYDLRKDYERALRKQGGTRGISKTGKENSNEAQGLSAG